MSSELIFNKKAFEEHRNVISPISFISKSGKPDKTTEVNVLFTLPYDVNIIEDATINSKVLEAYKSGEYSEDILKAFANTVYNMKQTNLHEAIYQYLIMNCRDIIINFNFRLLSKYYDLIKGADNIPEDPFFISDNYFCLGNRSEIIDNICKFIDNSLSALHFASCEIYLELNKIYFFQLMNNIYYQTVSFIDNTAILFANRYSTDFDHFKAIFKSVYNTEIDNNVIKDMTSEFRYTFVAAICREIIEKELPDLYQALHFIFENAARMSYTEPNPITITDLAEAAMIGGQKNE